MDFNFKALCERFQDERLAAYYAARVQLIKRIRERGSSTVDAMLEEHPEVQTHFRHVNQHGVIPKHPAFIIHSSVNSHRMKHRHAGQCRKWMLHALCKGKTVEQCLELTTDDVKSWEALRWPELLVES